MLTTRRPHKQLLYFWLVDELARSAQYSDCLDLACGDMQLYPYIQSRRYVGVDCDGERLQRAAERYPAAVPIRSRIEDIGHELRGDLVLCIQAIGKNKLFDVSNTLVALGKCIAATRPGGKLMVNFGMRSMKYKEEAADMLRTAFGSVEVRSYGAVWRGRAPYWLSWLVALALKSRPHLAATEKRPNVLFICEDRR